MAEVLMETPLFVVGQTVRVLEDYPVVAHYRTPMYFRGVTGTIERHCGAFANPEQLAHGLPVDMVHLYRVRARQVDVWPSYGGPTSDTIEVEIYEHWLAPVGDQ